MANNNEDINVRIGADVSDLDSGMKKAADAVSNSATKMSESMKTASDAAAKMGSSANAAASSVDKSSQSMGKSMQELTNLVKAASAAFQQGFDLKGISGINSQLAGFSTALKETQKNMESVSAASKKMGEDIGNNAKQANGHMMTMDSTLRQLRNAFLAGFTFNKLTEASDTFQKINGQLKISLGSTEAAKKGFEDVVRIANLTGQEIDSVTRVYRRFSDASLTLGITQSKVAEITETVAKSMAISGESAQSSKEAIIQFQQAISSGVLRGQEFNSVMEQAPRLAMALADGMGVPVSKLRELAMQGQITGQKMVEAMTKSKEKIDKEFNELPLTVSRAMQQLQNNFMVAVGQFNQSSGAFNALANSIKFVSEHLDGLASVGMVVAGIFAGRLLSSLVETTGGTIRLIAQLVASTASYGANTVAANINSLGLARNAAAAQAAAVASMELAVASRGLTVALAPIGGVIGLITTALSIGAAAWMAYGDSAEKATDNVVRSVREAAGNIRAEITKINGALGNMTLQAFDTAIADKQTKLKAISGSIDALKRSGLTDDNKEKLEKKLSTMMKLALSSQGPMKEAFNYKIAYIQSQLKQFYDLKVALTEQKKLEQEITDTVKRRGEVGKDYLDKNLGGEAQKNRAKAIAEAKATLDKGLQIVTKDGSGSDKEGNVDFAKVDPSRMAQAKQLKEDFAREMLKIEAKYHDDRLALKENKNAVDTALETKEAKKLSEIKRVNDAFEEKVERDHIQKGTEAYAKLVSDRNEKIAEIKERGTKKGRGVDVGKAEYNMTAQEVQAELQLLRTAYQDKVNLLDSELQHFRISYAKYRDERIAAVKELTDAEIEEKKKALAKAESMASDPKRNSLQREQAASKVVVIEKEIAALQEKQSKMITDQNDSYDKQVKLLEKSRVELAVKVADETGDFNFDDRKALIDAQFADMRKKFEVNGNAAGVALVDKMLNIEYLKVKMQEFERQIKVANLGSEIRQTEINTDVKTGNKEEIYAKRQINELIRQNAQETLALLQAELKEAQESGVASEEKIRGIELQIAKTKELAAVEDEVAKGVNQGLNSAFENFFSNITSGAKSFRDIFKSLFNDIWSSINKVMAKKMSEDLMGALGQNGINIGKMVSGTDSNGKEQAGGNILNSIIGSVFGKTGSVQQASDKMSKAGDILFESGQSMEKGGSTILGSISQFLSSIGSAIFGGSSSGGLMSSIGGLFSSGSSGEGGILSSIGGFFSSFGGFFAEGGQTSASGWQIVGEHGPEIFKSNSSGTVIPNNQAFGGGTTIHMSVNTPDANSFRKSSGQIYSEASLAMARANRRYG